MEDSGHVPSNHDDHAADETRESGDRIPRRDPVRHVPGRRPERTSGGTEPTEYGSGDADQPPLPIDISPREVREYIEQLTISRAWSAPMPEPETLRAYEEILPGAADRILKAFESVTVDASRRDDNVAEAAIWVRKNGAGWAFFFLLVVIVAAIVFFAVGNNAAGAALLGAPVIIGTVSLITAAMERR